MAAGEAAARLEGRPDSIRRNVLAALDEYLRLTPKPKSQTRQWLLAALDAADNDAWRLQARKAVVAGDWKTLDQLAREAEVPEQPPSFLLHVARTLPVERKSTRLKLFRRTQRAYPADLWANHDLAFELMQTGQPAEAIRYYTAALALRPHHPEIYFNRGIALQAAGELDAAIADYRTSLDLAPQYAAAHRKLAGALLEKGHIEEAIGESSKAIELDAKHALAWFYRGDAYRRLQQYEKAVRDFSKAIELDPKLAVAWVNRGGAYTQLHQYDKALPDLNKAIELDPKRAPAWRNRGAAYNELHQYDKALADLSKAIELDPKLALAWNDRGLAYHHLHQYDKALADLSKAIELDPKLALAWNNRGLGYLHLHQYDKALADLNQAIELDPKLAVAWSNRGFAYHGLNQYDKALADYTKALELQPDAVCENNLAWLLATCPETKLRDPKRAVDLAQKAVKTAPKEGNVWVTLGVAQYRMGDWQAAAAALQQAEKLLQPQGGFQRGVGRALFFQAMAQQQMGNASEARHAYNRALRWVETNRKALDGNPPVAQLLRRFQAEAEQLLRIKKK
jgi:tetratricopeptide (TPR) repeat protein